MIDLIEKAINGKNLISFRYDNENRLVEPHALGATSKGKMSMRGFQPAGGTQRELGWKLFTVDKIEDLTVLPLTFEEPRDGYSLNDKQLPHMVAQLDAIAA
ncbi:WYL domain-containing protein [Sphingomonas jaspsi]|uniref:WYL domain-containing protein n=1 Tax=Sphingomonas jaspsi TaxID=392409 RepID=UPI0004B99102|nr:WYL domain-containing protein [Sphingomonas jaspsi]